MNTNFCIVFTSFTILGGFFSTIYIINNNNNNLIIDSNPPQMPPILSPSPSRIPCYSCVGNPCRSCYNSKESGRYEYTNECCSYCGGCMV